jgi:hypothetical protein
VVQVAFTIPVVPLPFPLMQCIRPRFDAVRRQ